MRSLLRVGGRRVGDAGDGDGHGVAVADGRRPQGQLDQAVRLAGRHHHRGDGGRRRAGPGHADRVVRGRCRQHRTDHGAHQDGPPGTEGSRRRGGEADRQAGRQAGVGVGEGHRQSADRRRSRLPRGHRVGVTRGRSAVDTVGGRHREGIGRAVGQPRVHHRGHRRSGRHRAHRGPALVGGHGVAGDGRPVARRGGPGHGGVPFPPVAVPMVGAPGAPATTPKVCWTWAAAS